MAMDDKDPFGSDEMEAPADVQGKQLGPIEMPDAKFKDEQFAFNGEVAEEFENKVISRQIPGYNEMRHRLVNIAYKTALSDSYFVDLGTSNGRMIRDMVHALNNAGEQDLRNIEFIGADVVQDMLDKAETLFHEVQDQIVPAQFNYDLMIHDLRNGMVSIPADSAGFVSSVFTIQFVPPEHRPRIIQGIYDSLRPGAPFVWAEKVLSSNMVIDDLLTSIYYDEKSRNGIDSQTIATKRKSLEGNLMPFTHDGNIELLLGAGFERRNIETIWRNLQFEAIVAFK